MENYFYFYVIVGIALLILLLFFLKKIIINMKPDNYPDIIYKYRDWDNPNHQNILLQNEVFMSPPSDFNDPFDCRIPKNFTLLNTPEKIEKYVNDGIDKHEQWLLSEGRNIEFEKQQLKLRLNNIEQYQDEHENLEFSLTDKHYGILSLSARWNSILMWSHYGAFHKGFCIGFDEEIMRECGLFGKGGPVTYTVNFPELDPLEQGLTMETSFKQTHNKANDWNYEKEYRLTKLHFPKEPTIKDRIIKVPEEAIVEVNLGINISEKHRDEILVECNSRNIRIFQLKKVPFKFEITREQL